MFVSWYLLACADPADEGRGLKPADEWEGPSEDTAGGETGAPDPDDTGPGDTARDDTSGPDTGGDVRGDEALVAGFRASPYGGPPLGDAAYWEDVALGMAAAVTGSAPGGVWIVGVAGDDGACYLNFPSPGGSFDDIGFSAEDANEAALDRFDEAGMRVWLQVEPGDASVSTLAELVLDRYGHHPSVVGFGVDVEWFRWRNHEGGKAVSDENAANWREVVQGYEPGYSLFLKHWLTDRMPPTERDGLVFVDDGQGVGSLSELVDYFSEWGDAFAPSPVGFQFGYATDEAWWSRLDDPPADISAAIVDAVPNTELLLWVDFTVEEVFPR